MSVAVIDGACRSLGGHHLTSLQVIRKALPDDHPVFHVHRSADPQVAELLGEVRFDFTTDPYRPAAQRQRKAKRKWLWHAYQLGRRLRGRPADVLDGSYHRKDLEAIVRQYGPGDHVVSPTTRIDMLSSLLDVVGELPREALPHLHLRFLEFADTPDLPLAERTFRRLADLARSGAPVHLYCETKTLRRHLVDSFGLGPIDLCLLQPPPAEDELREEFVGAGDGVRVGFLGGSRRDKGFFRLPAILGTAVREHAPASAPPLRFVLQVSGGKNEEWLREQLANDDALSADQLEFVRGPLDERRFSALLSSCDILLLPYASRNSERLIGSGLLIDAKINATPVICAPHDTLEEFVSPGTGLVADSDREFGAAIATIAGDLASYREAATREAAVYRDLWWDNPLIARLRGA